jgi:ATP-binding cassette subfamily C protein
MAARERLLPSFAAFTRDFLGYGGRRAVIGAALLGVGAVLEGFSLLLLIPILGVVFDTGHDASPWRRLADRAFATVGAATQFERLVVLMAIYGALILVRGAVLTARDVQLGALQVGFLQHLRARLAEMLAGAPWAKLVRLRHARITHVMSGDLARVSTGANYLIQSSVSVVMLIAQCAIAMWAAPLLAMIAFTMLALIGLVVVPMVRRSQALGRHVTTANLTMLESTAELLGGLKLAISQNLQGSFVLRFRDTLDTLTHRQVDNVRQSALARLILNTLSAAVAAVIVLVGFGQLHTPPTVLITLLLIISRMSGPVTQLQQGVQAVAYALPAYEHMQRLAADLATPADERAAAAAVPAFPEGALVFEKVSFRHPAESEDGEPGRGVSGLDLVVEPGEFLGLAGPSGAGKTTFIDLLVGLLAPQGGAITVGGRPLEGEALAGWRAGLSYISQDPFLFHDSIRHNLAWAAPDADEAQMWRCLALAGADELVRRMERGLDTMVGERGSLVSGGERQRIALARALLRRPRLLVLDEATNAIDIASERALIEGLDRLEPRPTIVMVAHRAESLALCERVLTMTGGALCEAPRFGAPPLPAAAQAGA